MSTSVQGDQSVCQRCARVAMPSTLVSLPMGNYGLIYTAPYLVMLLPSLFFIPFPPKMSQRQRNRWQQVFLDSVMKEKPSNPTPHTLYCLM